MAKVTNSIALHSEEDARAYFENMRWPNGPVCPHCGVTEGHCYCSAHWQAHQGRAGGQEASPSPRWASTTATPARGSSPSVSARSLRNPHLSLAMWQCGLSPDVRQQEGHFRPSDPPHARHHLTRSAWFLAHRIREAMRTGSLAPPMGGTGRVVGSRRDLHRREGRPEEAARRLRHKNTVHDPGRARRIGPLVPCRQTRLGNAHARSCAPTSTAKPRSRPTMPATTIISTRGFDSHGTRQSHTDDEYVRGWVHTNTVEGYLLDLQARHEGRLSALLREAFAPLPCRVRLPLLEPHQARRRRCRAHGSRLARAWKASALPTGGLVGPDPKQEARRRKRQHAKRNEASAQLDLFPETLVKKAGG